MVVLGTEASQVPVIPTPTIAMHDMGSGRHGLGARLVLTRLADTATCLNILGLEIGDGVVRLAGAVDVLDHQRVLVVIHGGENL